jgi:hypothetical protein
VLDTGQPVKFTVQVFDAGGHTLSNAQVTVTVRDPDGDVLAMIPARVGSGAVYRSEPWSIPHGTPEGTWQMVVDATQADNARGQESGSFQVKNSASDTLLNHYGFWLDAPTLGGITPQLVAEQGDARNGMIRWGGIKIMGHIQPAVWVEVHWRAGDYGLENPAAVRHFMLGELGNLGFTRIRNIGPFERMQFKGWDGWQVGGQGQFNYDQVEWVVFYAPEADKTYAVGSTVVLPPPGVSPHAALRQSFAVHPEVNADGVAPKPLERLLPGPELLSPALGASFQGPEALIILAWEPVKKLAEDEYYEVVVDYNYQEGNFPVKFNTRETEVALPEALYYTPNCHIFNWRVTLMRQTATDADGQPQGEPISYASLYRYLWWVYPPGAEKPFTGTCPNAQF